MIHVAMIELSGFKDDPLRVDAKSHLSNSLENLDLTVDLKSPFQRWDKDAFLLKFKKTGASVMTSLLENKRGETPYTYTFKGSTDVDIIGNLLDFDSNNFRKSVEPF